MVNDTWRAGITSPPPAAPLADVSLCHFSFGVISPVPQGSWAPSMNVPTLLTTIRLLMAHPNGDDGLMPDIVRLVSRIPGAWGRVEQLSSRLLWDVLRSALSLHLFLLTDG